MFTICLPSRHWLWLESCFYQVIRGGATDYFPPLEVRIDEELRGIEGPDGIPALRSSQIVALGHNGLNEQSPP